MKTIIFERPDKTLGRIHPTPEALNHFSIESIAIKDTPFGLPFWIIENAEIPKDMTYRNAWELDGSQGEQDGYGNESNLFEE